MIDILFKSDKPSNRDIAYAVLRRTVNWLFSLLAVALFPVLSFGVDRESHVFGAELSAVVSGMLFFSLLNLNDLGREKGKALIGVLSSEFKFFEIAIAIILLYLAADTYYLSHYKISLLAFVGPWAVIAALVLSWICEAYIAYARVRLRHERQGDDIRPVHFIRVDSRSGSVRVRTHGVRDLRS